MSYNDIPGNETVGLGVNIIGKPYSTPDDPVGGRAQRIFDLGDPQQGQTWTEQTTGITYWVPPGLETPGSGNTDITAYSANSSSEFASQFSVIANVGGSYLGFSGQLGASYDESERDDSQYSYGFVVQNGVMWTISLDQSQATTTGEFQQDVANLPTTFDSSNAQQFYDFFARWGTHFVSTAEVGGKLYYYASVDKSYQTSMQDISASIEAEYKGLVASAQGQSEVDWGQVSSSWTDYRQTSIKSIGPGDESIDISSFLSPDYGTWLGANVLSNWQTAAQNDPRTTGVQLEPIYNAVDLSMMETLKTALTSYAASSITVTTEGLNEPVSNIEVIVTGEAVAFDNSPGQTWGIAAVVLDRATLKQRLARFYQYEDPTDRHLAEMKRDVSAAATGDFIIVLATYGMNTYNMYPAYNDQSFYDLMVSCGAGSVLDIWSLQSPSGHVGLSSGSGVQPPEFAYVLIGANDLGYGVGVEKFVPLNYYAAEQGTTIEVVAYLDPSGGRYTPETY